MGEDQIYVLQEISAHVFKTYQDFCSSVTVVLSAQNQPFLSALNDNPSQNVLLGNVLTSSYAE